VGNGLTVFLKKTFGNIFIDKMRAICLLEADYNWLNKFIFAKKMMDKAYSDGVVPAEQFAQRGTQAAEGVLTSTLFCDIIRALHHTGGIESVDLGNCYDAVAHPITSIAMQSFKVQAVVVAMSLSVLQTMNLYIKSGFGQSTLTYGGTKDDPTFGLAQGNGAAPPGFLAVSTLMINAYRALGHGTSFVGAWSGDVFFLAAVLFVDNSDLLHMVNSQTSTNQAFFDKVWKASFDWGRLVQATGGYLKHVKCFWYMMFWRWSKGKLIMKKLMELPRTPLLIPQPDGSRASIPLKDNKVAEKKLGVWTCPSGDFGVHVKKASQKGLMWADNMMASRCPPRDAWLGLRYQLYCQMSYGFVALVHPPDLLEKAFQDVWYKCLPSLKVNRCIRKEWRMLPLRF
jgi:hypothetical protein